MTKTYQIKINQGKDTQTLDIPQAGVKGQAVTVKAVSGARYQLIDTTTQYGPENIRVSRQGKDMKVSFEGSNTTDLVIEDYYKVSPEGYNGLIGEAETGRFYEYIPESASGLASVPMLAESGPVVGMALGGAEVAPAGAAVGVLAAGLFNPVWLGAGALGAAAAAGGGGGGGAGAASAGGGTTDTTAPNGGEAVGLSIDLDSSNDGSINGAEKGTATTTSLTATFDKTKVVVGDVVTFVVGAMSKAVSLTAADVTAGKVTSTGWELPAEGETLTATATIKDLAENVSATAMTKANIDLSASARIIETVNGVSVTGIKIETEKENIVYKTGDSDFWNFLEHSTVNSGSKEWSNNQKFIIADDSGNLILTNSYLDNEISKVDYSSINKGVGVNLKIVDIPSKGIDAFSSVKSIDLLNSKVDTFSIDLLDVLNHGVIDPLKLGSTPQLKIDGDTGDLLRMTDKMGSLKGWIIDETSVVDGYKHYVGYSLGLKVDLLVDKDITII